MPNYYLSVLPIPLDLCWLSVLSQRLGSAPALPAGDAPLPDCVHGWNRQRRHLFTYFHIYGPTMGSRTIAQIGSQNLASKAKMDNCQKVKLSFKVILKPLAARGYAGILVNVFKKTYAKYQPNPKQTRFRYIQFVF